MAERLPETVTLLDGVWGCCCCAAPARELPDMTAAIEAGNPHAHVLAVIDHAASCPIGSSRVSHAAPDPGRVAMLIGAPPPLHGRKIPLGDGPGTPGRLVFPGVGTFVWIGHGFRAREEIYAFEKDRA